MPSPDIDPRIVQIMDALCAKFLLIKQDNAFYNDVAGAGIEPLSFNENDSYPQIVVRLNLSDITDSNERGYQDDTILESHGFLPITAVSVNGYRSALKLLDDMTRLVRSITPETFKAVGDPPPETGYVNPAKQLVTSWSVNQKREIVESEIAEGFLEVIVRVAVGYRDFSPPAPGI